MMQVKVITLDNAEAGEIELPEALFGAEPRVDIMAAATGVPQDEKHDADPAPTEDDATDPDGDRPD